MRLLIYAFAILIVPGGFLFCAAHIHGRWRRRKMVERNRIAANNARWNQVVSSRSPHRESWDRPEPCSLGSASTYVPDWAKPLTGTRKPE